MDLKKKHKRRGLIATILYHVALILMFIFVGLTYQDPPPEEGIAINFGYEDDGSGNTSQSQPQETPQQPQQEVVEETAEEVINEVATQEVVDAPNVTQEEEKKPQKEQPKEDVKEEPKPDNNLLNALNKTKNSQEAGQGEGEGETEGGADQGDRNGDPNSSNRTGNGGIGNSGNYRLGNRKALQKPTPVYDCDEQGRVIVKVKVDRSGRTISAEAGVNIPNGPKSNATASCLLKRAREAAKKTTWQGDPTATEWQTGYIIYNFTKR